MSKQPPHVNGVMELLDEQIVEIREKLILIASNFEESDEQPVCDTFYVTSKYNAENEFKVNGDTVDSLLAHNAEEVAQEGEV